MKRARLSPTDSEGRSNNSVFKEIILKLVKYIRVEYWYKLGSIIYLLASPFTSELFSVSTKAACPTFQIVNGINQKGHVKALRKLPLDPLKYRARP